MLVFVSYVMWRVRREEKVEQVRESGVDFVVEWMKVDARISVFCEAESQEGRESGGDK